jgi:diamine N-acetyltransferase
MDIYLKELEPSDLITLNRWRANHEIIDCLSSSYRFISIEVDKKWYENYLINRANNIRLAIFSQCDNKLLGAVYLIGIDWVIRSCELALWIGEIEAQGKGVGEAATKFVLNHAFNDLNLHRVHLTVLANNIRAQNLYKKVGFIEEGCLRKAAFKNGSYIDLIQMSILAEEFNLCKVNEP